MSSADCSRSACGALERVCVRVGGHERCQLSRPRGMGGVVGQVGGGQGRLQAQRGDIDHPSQLGYLAQAGVRRVQPPGARL